MDYNTLLLGDLQLIPKQCWGTIDNYLLSKSFNDLNEKLIYETAPGIFGLIIFMKRNPILCDYYCPAILSFILKTAKQSVITKVKNIIPIDINNRINVHFNSDKDEYVKTGVYFPGRPVQRLVRNCYIKEAPGCNKDHNNTGVFGAGLALFWCARHRHCIGFVLLQSAESCRIVYETLATRFAIMPKYIIYDNGCNLMEYCFNRQPDVFKDTIFLSDGFHWKNHVNCGVYFNSSVYASISDVCSVTNEQKNVKIAKQKCIVIHLAYDAFLS